MKTQHPKRSQRPAARKKKNMYGIPIKTAITRQRKPIRDVAAAAIDDLPSSDGVLPSARRVSFCEESEN